MIFRMETTLVSGDDSHAVCDASATTESIAVISRLINQDLRNYMPILNIIV